MKGVVLPETPIAIDCFWENDSEEHYTHFLSHIHMEVDCDFEAMKKCTIFTTEMNRWFLIEYHQFDPDKLICIPERDQINIRDKKRGLCHKVKTIDSNYCLGSVMFLIEGDTGNFLYAGNFRYYEGLMDIPDLQKFYSGDSTLEILYLDSPWSLNNYPLFPSKYDVLQDILKLVRNSLDHYLVFLSPHFGNEELFVAIALQLEELVYICPERCKILKYANCSRYFTEKMEESRLWVLNYKEFLETDINCLEAPLKVILLGDPNFKGTQIENVHHYPYYSHSSRDELVFFVSALKPSRSLKTMRVNKPENHHFVCALELEKVPSKSKLVNRKRKLADRFSNENEGNSNRRSHVDFSYLDDMILETNNRLQSDLQQIETNVCETPNFDDSKNSDEPDVSSFWSYLTGCDVSKLRSLPPEPLLSCSQLFESNVYEASDLNNSRNSDESDACSFWSEFTGCDISLLHPLGSEVP